jgi:hypothetical protein
MNYTFVVNGVVQLVLIPETELDRLLLEKTLDGLSSIEVTKLTQPVSILGKPVTDSYVIKSKSHVNSSALSYNHDSSET